MKFISFIFFTFTLSAQVQYNHPEIDWRTFETDNFRTIGGLISIIKRNQEK